ncbi:MAG: helix-turn-helix transcriptional regulator [Chloroflexota bacterium]
MIESMPVYDDIRIAINASGKSRYRLWQETGISQPQLSQFMAGTKGLSIEALENLARCMDMEIVARPIKRRGKRKDG